MNDVRLRRVTGILLILTPVAFNVFFTLLSVTFGYPDILREPAGYVLRSFDAGGGGLVAIWYGFMLTAVLFVPLAVLVHRVLAGPGAPFYLGVATAFGVVAGVVQFLGLVRWPILVPYLADVYLDPGSSEATRESAEVVFGAFNQYSGVAVGENLGYMFTGLWTALVSLAMMGSPLFGRWLGWAGLVAAAGIFVGILEPAGFGAAADIVVVGYILWSLWLAAAGISFSGVSEPERRKAGAARAAGGSGRDRGRRAMSGRRFFVLWMLTFLGFPLGGTLALLVVGSVEGPADGAVGGALAGAVLGAAQWLVLRGRLAVGPLWILATALALGLGDAAGAALTGAGTRIGGPARHRPGRRHRRGVVAVDALARARPRARCCGRSSWR